MFITFTTTRPGIQSLVVKVEDRKAMAMLTSVLQSILQEGFAVTLDMNSDQNGLQVVDAWDLDTTLGL
jgi:hypothetical protein